MCVPLAAAGAACTVRAFRAGSSLRGRSFDAPGATTSSLSAGKCRAAATRRTERPTHRGNQRSTSAQHSGPAVPRLAVGGDGEESPPAHPHLLELLRWFAPTGDEQSLENMHPVISKSMFIALVGFVDQHKGVQLRRAASAGRPVRKSPARLYLLQRLGAVREILPP